MKQTTVILVAGHGGMIDGIYQTAGKRSPTWDNGKVLYEGEYNRQIKYRLMELLASVKIPYIDLVPEQEDISLSERLRRAEAYYKKNKNCIFIEIHANGHSNPQANGVEVLISRYASQTSKFIANCFMEHYKDHHLDACGVRFRGIKDNRPLYLMDNVPMPSVLIESPFMTNKSECNNFLLDRYSRDMIANWHYLSIVMALHKINQQ